MANGIEAVEVTRDKIDEYLGLTTEEFVEDKSRIEEAKKRGKKLLLQSMDSGLKLFFIVRTGKEGQKIL
ncbi:hypothetical protein KKG83_02015 [Candidatus Micrarchaeota archaeon]|nr:hypothetical protein [Candidatus Micrarchaeota archaeon]